MKLLLISLFINLVGIKWHNTPQQVEWMSAQINIDGIPQSFSAVRFKQGSATVGIANCSGAEADSISALAERYGAIAAVNGSYFNMKTLCPITYVKDDMKVVGATIPSELSRTDGLLCSNGKKIKIFASDSLHYHKHTKRYTDAIASGPVLLLKGKPTHKQWPLTSFYAARHPRTFVGTTKNGYIYLVVVDGRAKGHAAGMTIPETASLAQALGLRDAINLDGGGSSSLYLAPQGILSHPCDNKRFDPYGQRIVPNIIYVQQTH